ncbi:GntR family transcriptional regulator [Actinomycetales bacterium SN12]|nr:GntR family transcriptional regulator [Actinomycetales bacterium SN12]
MKIALSPGAGSASEQVHSQLRGLIAAGWLQPGRRLPPVRQLAADLGLAAGTVARAYKRLEQEGLVVSRAGAGTHVCADVATIPRDVVRAARSFAVTARRAGLGYEDAERILKAVWVNDG